MLAKGKPPTAPDSQDSAPSISKWQHWLQTPVHLLTLIASPCSLDSKLRAVPASGSTPRSGQLQRRQRRDWASRGPSKDAAVYQTPQQM